MVDVDISEGNSEWSSRKGNAKGMAEAIGSSTATEMLHSNQMENTDVHTIVEIETGITNNSLAKEIKTFHVFYSRITPLTVEELQI